MSVAISELASSELAQSATFFMCGCSACSGKTALSEVAILSEVVSRNLISVPASAIADEPVGTVVAVGGSVSGVIDTTGDLDYFSVNLVAGQTYLFSLRGTGSTPVTDTFLVLYGTTGSFAAFDDDGGNGTNSLLTFTATTSGTYTIEASSFANPGDPGLGGYTIDVRQRGADAVGNTNATSVALSQGTTFGFRETGSDVDRYSVTLEAGKYYEFKLAAGADYNTNFNAVPTGEVDTILRLRSSTGQIIASNDDVNFPSDISSAIGFFATQSGTYYLDATGYSPQTGGYAIEFKEIPITDLDPLDSINWFSSTNVQFTTVNGVRTAYVYFGDSDENFGQTNDAGTGPMITIDWNEYEKGQVMKALEEFENILGVNYVITTDVNQATFRLLKTESQAYGAYFFPQDPAFGASQGVGVFNVLSGGWNFDQQQSLERGGYSYSVILHEFGHAHGLAHPHDNGGGSAVMLGVTGPTGTLGVFDLNQGVHTVMSYNDAWQRHPDGPSAYDGPGIDNGWPATLSAFDIAVLQQRYGVQPHNGGDTVYQLADSVDEAFYETIWDSGGTDTIAYGGMRDTQIDLTAATLDYTATGGGVVSFVRNAPGTPSAEQLKGGFIIAGGVVIENASGGGGNDVLIGNAAANRLLGNGGNDTLMGRDGADTLEGGAGNDRLDGGTGGDRMTGGLGDDTFVVDDAGDVVVEAFNGGIDTVESSINYTLTLDVNNLTLAGAALNGTGNGLGNVITGNDLANVLNGLGGDDILFGGKGNDRLDGSASNDTLHGEDDDDLLDGGSGDDRLFGGSGVDRLLASAGNDVLDGGAGVDTLTSGSGKDILVFLSAGDIGVVGAGLHDVVTDFQQGYDKIDFSGMYGTGDARAGYQLRTDGNRMTDMDTSRAYDVSFYTERGKTFIVGDVDGDGRADFGLELNGSIRLKASDFIIDQAQWNAAVGPNGPAYADFHAVLV